MCQREAGGRSSRTKARLIGRATQMAKDGHSLPSILNAGEWRSAALFNYVDLDAVDAHVALNTVFEVSDAEGP